MEISYRSDGLGELTPDTVVSIHKASEDDETKVRPGSRMTPMGMEALARGLEAGGAGRFPVAYVDTVSRTTTAAAATSDYDNDVSNGMGVELSEGEVKYQLHDMFGDDPEPSRGISAHQYVPLMIDNDDSGDPVDDAEASEYQ